MERDRYRLFCDLIDTFDEGCNLTEEYDSLLHDYNGVLLYQAESQVIKMIGNQKGITAAEIARQMKKTDSACSQLVSRLRKKGWVVQRRNEDNNREYHLYLTREGEQIYQKHREFEEKCYKRTFHELDPFTDLELKTYIEIQKRMNSTFRQDVKESRQLEKRAATEQKSKSAGKGEQV